MRLRISEVREVCMKHPGMWDDFWRAGTRSLDCIEINREAFEAINQRHLGSHGLGTFVHTLLKPVVAVADTVTGSKLADCGGCTERGIEVECHRQPERVTGGPVPVL